VQDYVQITFHGVPTGPLVPLDENGQAEVPLYMSPGSYFVGANDPHRPEGDGAGLVR
jgi:antitoxin (DNA-binding transcriptional repressor) of toxin-antitoxin stability system